MDLPVIEERLTQIGASLVRLEKAGEERIRELKVEDIGDLRKNICRLWMRVDELMADRNRAKGGLDAMHGLVLILGVVIGGAAMFVGKH